MTIKYIRKLVKNIKIVFMIYIGSMSQTLLSGVIEALEEEKEISNISKKTSHHIFTVLIEMTQNIIKHSKNKSGNENKFNSNSLILLGKDDDNFYVHSENIVTVENKNKIEEKIENIKKLTKDEINYKYKELRRTASNAHSAGAGIGFYEIAKRARKIKYKFEEINDNKFKFYLTIEIK